MDRDPSVVADYLTLARDVVSAANLPQPRHIERVGHGIANHVYIAGDLVIRFGTGSDASGFPRAVAVLRAAENIVRVPRVIYEDCQCAMVPVPVMIVERMPGEPLARLWPTWDERSKLSILEAMAEMLHALHGLRPADVPAARFSTPWWKERAERIERLLVALRPTPGIPDPWFDRMSSYFDEHRAALTDSPVACIVHNDVTLDNILVSRGNVTALLDFDCVLAAPAELDWWGLLFASDNFDPWVEPSRLQRLPGFDLSAPGVLERFRIGEIESLLDLLSGELSWIEPAEALQEAHETFQDAFLSDHYDRLLERFTG